MTSALIWEHVEGDITPSPHGCIVFDDSVLDKNHSHSIEMVRRQYSGNAHGVIKGIGMVNCLYVNPDTGQYWIVDYRLYDPDGDGKTKPDHVQDMLLGLVASKGLDFNRVLMDSWYATKELMLVIEKLDKLYYCPLKSNRLVDDSGGRAEVPPCGFAGLVSSRAGAGQDHQDQGISQRTQSEIIPGRGFQQPHGLGRDERAGSGLIECHARCVWHSLED